MFKYLHEVLGLLHDFLSESQEPGTGRLDDRRAGNERVGAAPERRAGSPVRKRPAPLPVAAGRARCHTSE